MRFLNIKDFIIIFFIIIVIIAVLLVFYTEIINNNKIRVSKNNFILVKEELVNEFLKCRDKNLDWIFGFSCKKKPSVEILANYFNSSKKIVNPYDKKIGVNGSAGSVLIIMHDNIFILSVDIDANGGIDIEHRIKGN